MLLDSNSRNLGMLYSKDPMIDIPRRVLVLFSRLRGHQTATNLSIVTMSVAKTDPTRPICTKPNLS